MTRDTDWAGYLYPQDELKSDRHPTHTGKLRIDGKEYRLVAWEKQDKSGQTFLSVQASVWQERTTLTTAPAASRAQEQSKAAEALHPELYAVPKESLARTRDDPSDDIPF